MNCKAWAYCILNTLCILYPTTVQTYLGCPIFVCRKALRSGVMVLWCVRLSLLLVGFRTHFKSLHFHSFIHSFHIQGKNPFSVFRSGCRPFLGCCTGVLLLLERSKRYLKGFTVVACKIFLIGYDLQSNIHSDILILIKISQSYSKK